MIDEATFSKMGDMIDDPELAKEFPVIAYINKLRENKTQEEKDKGNEYLVALLTECGFDKMLALLGMLRQNELNTLFDSKEAGVELHLVFS